MNKNKFILVPNLSIKKITGLNNKDNLRIVGNPYIDLVKKWLANPDSVSQKERDENVDAAYADWADAYHAAEAAYHAATYAAHADVERAKYWVEKYVELVK